MPRPQSVPLTYGSPRLWERMTVVESGCWISQRHADRRGYPMIGGRLGVDERKRELRLGRLIVALRDSLPFGDRGWMTLHSCDTPACCNPAHLRAGTRRENVDDMVAKGRQARGERSGRAKLTTAQVADIRARRAAGEPRSALAQQYQIHVEHVTLITRRVVWR